MKLILGGPGCGKTTRLLGIVQEELARGVPSDEIAFVAFTKAAAEDAKRRAAETFGLDPKEDLPWFRTIHSLAYRSLGLMTTEVMSRDNWKEFGDLIGETITGKFSTTDMYAVPGSNLGDKMLRVCDYCATTLMPLRDAWDEVGDGVDWWRLERFDNALNQFKSDLGKKDFTDMLLNFVEDGQPVPVRIAVIDEAQDLTAAQWAVVKLAFRGAERVYVGGDDDQAIYRWAGADVDTFLGLSEAPEVLELSHRLSPEVFDVGQRIARQIRHRYEKPYRPTEKPGVVDWHQDPSWLPLQQDEGSWLILARNGYLLEPIEEMLRARGVHYGRRGGPAASVDEVGAVSVWTALHRGLREDVSAAEARLLYKALGRPRPALREMDRYGAEQLKLDLDQSWYTALEGIPLWRRDFYVACLNRGEDLRKPPRVIIETIHGVKGAEADHVAVLTDISRRTAESFERDPDHEHRVFYVAVTRAIQSLHLIAPQSYTRYPGLFS